MSEVKELQDRFSELTPIQKQFYHDVINNPSLGYKLLDINGNLHDKLNVDYDSLQNGYVIEHLPIDTLHSLIRNHPKPDSLVISGDTYTDLLDNIKQYPINPVTSIDTYTEYSLSLFLIHRKLAVDQHDFVYKFLRILDKYNVKLANKINNCIINALQSYKLYSTDVNKYLYSGKIDSNISHVYQKIYWLDMAFMLAPRLSKPMIVYRGMHVEITNGIFQNYMSTTFNFSKIFGKDFRASQCCGYVILVPAGTPYIYLDLVYPMNSSRKTHEQSAEFSDSDLPLNTIELINKYKQMFEDKHKMRGSATDYVYDSIGEGEILLPRDLKIVKLDEFFVNEISHPTYEELTKSLDTNDTSLSKKYRTWEKIQSSKNTDKFKMIIATIV